MPGLSRDIERALPVEEPVETAGDQILKGFGRFKSCRNFRSRENQRQSSEYAHDQANR